MLCTVYSFVDSDLGHWYCIVLYCSVLWAQTGRKDHPPLPHKSKTPKLHETHNDYKRHTVCRHFASICCSCVFLSSCLSFQSLFSSHFSHFTFVCLTVAVCISFWSLCISLQSTWQSQSFSGALVSLCSCFLSLCCVFASVSATYSQLLLLILEQHLNFRTLFTLEMKKKRSLFPVLL